MESDRKARERNLGQLIQSGIDTSDALELQLISRRLHHLDENACNYGLSPRQEKQSDNLEKKATEIAAKYNRIAYHQSDPRGWSLYIIRPEQLGGYEVQANYNAGLAISSH